MPMRPATFSSRSPAVSSLFSDAMVREKVWRPLLKASSIERGVRGEPGGFAKPRTGEPTGTPPKPRRRGSIDRGSIGDAQRFFSCSVAPGCKSAVRMRTLFRRFSFTERGVSNIRENNVKFRLLRTMTDTDTDRQADLRA